ncbi:hypothetical protein [Nocardia brevicatena]|uniref:hypothetical protein n=1 Tax=Nocardia brevicatena TaxID=37327 RepID=UPI0003106700|nr:hypothetical protein [Nocardia brevicatena]
MAARTDGFSGSDLARLCESTAERALIDSARTGQVRMIDTAGLETVLREVRPSVSAWFESARSAAVFTDEGGLYDELVAYLKRTKSL